MSTAASNIDAAFAFAGSLSSVQKLELISRLWEDVRSHGEFHLTDVELAEIQRRSAELDAGIVKTVPWSEAQESVDRILGSK